MTTGSGAAPDPPPAVGVKADADKAGGVASIRKVRSVVVGGASLILVADVLTKELAVRLLAEREPVRLLGGAVCLVLTRNGGAAFSLGQSFTYVFPLFTVVAVCWVGVIVRRVRSLPWAVALGLVLGGAVGNLGDRLFRAPGPLVGHVVDFVSLFDDAGRVWPVFNLADSALVVGLSMVASLELTGRRRDGTRTRHG